MIEEEKIRSRMVELASRSDGRRGLYCICSHMGWRGFLLEDGKVEISLEGIPGKIKTESIRIDGRTPGEWLWNYHMTEDKICLDRYMPGEIKLKAEDEYGREKNFVLHVKLCG